MNFRQQIVQIAGRWVARLQGRALREQADAAAQHPGRLGSLVAPQKLLHLQTQRLNQLLPLLQVHPNPRVLATSHMPHLRLHPHI